MLFVTGLMGLSSLYVLIKALSFGAMGFICIKYFCWFLSDTFVQSVGFVFEMIPWDLYLICIISFSCINVSIFCFNVSLCIMTMVLPLSDFAIVRLFCSSRVFICFRLYWCLVFTVLHVFVSAICLNFLVFRYLNVFCILTSKYLIAFSVSIINMLINFLGLFSIA